LLVCVSLICPGSTLLSFLTSRDVLTNEESSLVDALLAVFESRMLATNDVSALRVLMREVFPSSVRLRTSYHAKPTASVGLATTYHAGQSKPTTTYDMLNDAIISQLRASGLHPIDCLVSKVKLLYCYIVMYPDSIKQCCSLSVCLSACLPACLPILFASCLHGMPMPKCHQ